VANTVVRQFEASAKAEQFKIFAAPTIQPQLEGPSKVGAEVEPAVNDDLGQPACIWCVSKQQVRIGQLCPDSEANFTSSPLMYTNVILLT
jgi:hypothetical protein